MFGGEIILVILQASGVKESSDNGVHRSNSFKGLVFGENKALLDWNMIVACSLCSNGILLIRDKNLG